MHDPAVLVVDVAPPLRNNPRDCFEDLGFRVLTAKSAGDALEMLRHERAADIGSRACGRVISGCSCTGIRPQ